MSQKIEMGKTYKTRDGKPVRILATDVKGKEKTVVAAVLERNGEEGILTYFSDGSCYKVEIDYYDLIEVKPERTIWVNIYRDHDDPEDFQDGCYEVKKSLTEAKAHTGTMTKILIARKQITFTEGEGLEESDY